MIEYIHDQPHEVGEMDGVIPGSGVNGVCRSDASPPLTQNT
jgi:hypothetical protein